MWYCGQILSAPDMEQRKTVWQTTRYILAIMSMSAQCLVLIDTTALFGAGVKIIGHLEYTGTGINREIFIRKQDIDKLSEEALGDYKKGMLSIVFTKVKDGVDISQLVAKIRNINPNFGIMTTGSIGTDIRNTLNDILRIFTVTIHISSLLAILLAWSTFSDLLSRSRFPSSEPNRCSDNLKYQIHFGFIYWTWHRLPGLSRWCIIPNHALCRT